MSEAGRSADRGLRLVELGLTAYQSRVYLALLDGGGMDAAAVAAASGVPRTRVYEVCRALNAYGLVEETTERPRRYVARPLDAYLDRLRSALQEEARQFDEQAVTLAREFRAPGDPPARQRRPGVFLTFHGRPRVRERLMDVLTSGAERVTLRADAATMRELPLLLRESATRPGFPVEVRVLAAPGQLVRVAPALLPPGVRCRESGAAPDPPLAVAGEAQALLLRWSEDPSKDVALWTDERALVEGFERAAEAAWEAAARRSGPPLPVPVEGPPADPPRLSEVLEGAARRARDRLDVFVPEEALRPSVPSIEPLPPGGGDVRVLAPAACSAAARRLLPEGGRLRLLQGAPRAQARWVLDEREAGIARVSGGSRAGPALEGLALVTDPALVACERDLFEAMWSRALDLPPVEEPIRKG